jgi:hypothetical protein
MDRLAQGIMFDSVCGKLFIPNAKKLNGHQQNQRSRKIGRALSMQFRSQQLEACRVN